MIKDIPVNVTKQDFTKSPYLESFTMLCIAETLRNPTLSITCYGLGTDRLPFAVMPNGSNFEDTDMDTVYEQIQTEAYGDDKNEEYMDCDLCIIARNYTHIDTKAKCAVFYGGELYLEDGKWEL